VCAGKSERSQGARTGSILRRRDSGDEVAVGEGGQSMRIKFSAEISSTQDRWIDPSQPRDQSVAYPP